MHVAFLFLHLVCWFVYVQGEKGEPGFVIAADGSMMSGLAGPVGPKGLKVTFVVVFFFLSRSRSFSSYSRVQIVVSLFQGDLGVPGPAGIQVSFSSNRSKKFHLSGLIATLPPVVSTATDADAMSAFKK